MGRPAHLSAPPRAAGADIVRNGSAMTTGEAPIRAKNLAAESGSKVSRQTKFSLATALHGVSPRRSAHLMGGSAEHRQHPPRESRDLRQVTGVPIPDIRPTISLDCGGSPRPSRVVRSIVPWASTPMGETPGRAPALRRDLRARRRCLRSSPGWFAVLGGRPPRF